MTIFLDVLKRIWPFIVAAMFGASGAWYVQGLRLTAANQEFTGYKQAAEQAVIDAEESDNKRRKESSRAYAEKQKQLEVSIKAGDVYRRCVDAGKCGGVPVSTSCSGSGISLPPIGREHEDGGSSISAPRESAPQVVIDCAKVQLRLNQIQGEVEAQPRFFK